MLAIFENATYKPRAYSPYKKKLNSLSIHLKSKPKTIHVDQLASVVLLLHFNFTRFAIRAVGAVCERGAGMRFSRIQKFCVVFVRNLKSSLYFVRGIVRVAVLHVCVRVLVCCVLGVCVCVCRSSIERIRREKNALRRHCGEFVWFCFDQKITSPARQNKSKPNRKSIFFFYLLNNLETLNHTVFYKRKALSVRWKEKIRSSRKQVTFFDSFQCRRFQTMWQSSRIVYLPFDFCVCVFFIALVIFVVGGWIVGRAVDEFRFVIRFFFSWRRKALFQVDSLLCE